MMEQLRRSEQFVKFVLEQCQKDRGFTARMRRADNPDTEFHAYGILASFGIALERDDIRRPYVLTGATLSRSQQEGNLGLGTALRYSVQSIEQGEARLRRLLACHSQEEVCRILRPLLRLIQAKNTPISCARLLDDLLAFRFEEARHRICLRWAQEFYTENDSKEKQECNISNI